MSIRISHQLWTLPGIPPIKKLALLKLADNANDEGLCWPSIATVADACGVSVRTVQGAIVWAEEHTLLYREMRLGKATVYHMTLEKYVPPCDLHPAPCNVCPADAAPPPPQSVQSPPQITASSIDNHQEPLFEPLNEPPPTRVKANPDLQIAFDEWNVMATDIQLPQAQNFNAQRRQKITARLRDSGGIDGWRACLAKIRGSPFLRGDPGKFRATFDWVLNPTNFTKIMEGNYDEKRNANQSNRNQSQPRLTPTERIIAAALSGGDSA